MPTAKTKVKKPIKKIRKTPARRIAKPPATPATVQPWYYEARQEEKEIPKISEKPKAVVNTLEQGAPYKKRFFLCCVFSTVTILFPFIATPWSSTAEFSKLIFLSIAIGVSLLIVLAQSLYEKKFTLVPRHPFVLLGFGFLVVAIISALRSGTRYTSFWGYGGTEALSLAGVFLGGLWILLAYYAGREHSRLPSIALTISGSLLSLLTILSLFGINFYKFTGVTGFNPAGTTTTSALIASATLMLAIGFILKADSRRATILAVLALLPPVVLLIGTSFRAPLIVTALGLVLLTLGQLKEKRARGLRTLILILAFGTLLSIILAVRPFLSFLKTPLEIGPSHKETWSVAMQTLKDHPLLGSGPATFSADYLRFRSLPVLQTQFWNVSFDWGSSAGLTWLTTYGWLGGILLAITLLSVFVSYYLQKLRYYHEPLNMALFAAGITLFVGSWLAPMPLSARLFLDALLGLMLARLNLRPLKLNLGGLAGPLFSTLMILLVLGLFALQGKRALAEVYMVKGATIGLSDINTAESYLVKATRVDSRNDAYLRLLAEVRRAKLEQKLSTTAPNAQDELQAIRDLTDATLTPARRATELARGNAANWMTLGNIYLDIAGVTSGAGNAAANAFGKAQALSPSDPSILVNLSLAKMLSTQGASGEESKALTQSAEELLRKAADIRPSYAFAHLQLARLLAQKGDTEGALQAYRQTQTLAQSDASLRYEIGLYLLQNQRVEAAQVDLEAAVELSPNFSNARWFLAQVYETQGALDKAIEQIQKVIELNPDSQQAKDRLTELQKKLEKKK